MPIAFKLNSHSTNAQFSEAHNARKIEPDYLLKKEHRLTNFHTQKITPENYTQKATKIYKEKVGQKLHPKTQLFHEAILVFGAKELEQLYPKYIDKNFLHKELHERAQAYAQHLHEKYGFEILSIHTHCDEGHITKSHPMATEKPHYNIHTHILLGNVNYSTGRTCRRKMTKKNLSEEQTKVAETFNQYGFERGIKDKKKVGLEHKEFKAVAQETAPLIQKIKILENNLSAANKEIEMLKKSTESHLSSKIQPDNNFLSVSTENEVLKAKIKEIEGQNKAFVEKMKELEGKLSQELTRKETRFLDPSLREKTKEDLISEIGSLRLKIEMLQEINGDYVAKVEQKVAENKARFDALTKIFLELPREVKRMGLKQAFEEFQNQSQKI